MVEERSEDGKGEVGAVDKEAEADGTEIKAGEEAEAAAGAEQLLDPHGEPWPCYKLSRGKQIDPS